MQLPPSQRFPGSGSKIHLKCTEANSLECIFLVFVLQCNVSSDRVFEVLTAELNMADVPTSTYRNNLCLVLFITLMPCCIWCHPDFPPTTAICKDFCSASPGFPKYDRSNPEERPQIYCLPAKYLLSGKQVTSDYHQYLPLFLESSMFI